MKTIIKKFVKVLLLDTIFEFVQKHCLIHENILYTTKKSCVNFVLYNFYLEETLKCYERSFSMLCDDNR